MLATAFNCIRTTTLPKGLLFSSLDLVKRKFCLPLLGLLLSVSIEPKDSLGTQWVALLSLTVVVVIVMGLNIFLLTQSDENAFGSHCFKVVSLGTIHDRPRKRGTISASLEEKKTESRGS